MARYENIWTQFKGVSAKYRKVGFALVSREGVFLDCTPAFADLLDRDSSELIGLKISDISLNESESATKAKMEALFGDDGIGHICTLKKYLSPSGKTLYRRLESQIIVESNRMRLASISVLYEANTPESEFLDLKEQLDAVNSEINSLKPQQVFNMNNSNNDQSNTADNGANISHGSGNSQGVSGAVIVAITIVGATIVLGITALLASGTLTFNAGAGGTSLEVNQPAESEESK